MTIAQPIRPAHYSLEELFDALVDPARCERTMGLLLAGYTAVWSLYGVLAKGGQDLNFDMGEMVAWSREVSLGTPKHPPLGAWLVRIWFDVFPLEVWAYYLFAAVLAAAALWIAWRIAGRYLTPEKRAVGIMLLTLVPFYNFHALRFNANSVVTPFWAATTWWFLRSFETRRPGWAVLAGAGATAAMLGKYWSVFLVLGLIVAAISDRRRGAYFRSAAPWLTVGTGIILLAPHVIWLAMHHFDALRYAVTGHAVPLAAAARAAPAFLAGILGYITAPILLTMIAARPSVPAISDAMWPADSDRRTIMIAFLAPLVLAMAAAVALQDQIVSLWAMSAMTLLPVVLLSSPMITISRAAAVRLLAAATAFPLIMVAISPLIALVIHRNGVDHYATHYRLIARAIEDEWSQRTSAPLRIVGSYTNVVNGIVFYLRSEPSTLDIVSPAQTPWISADRIAREGAAIVCPMPETDCLKAMGRYAAQYPAAQAEEVTIRRGYLGELDPAVRYRILIVRPQTR